MYNIAHVYIYTHCIYNTLLHHEIRSDFPNIGDFSKFHVRKQRPLFSAVLAMLYWPVWC